MVKRAVDILQDRLGSYVEYDSDTRILAIQDANDIEGKRKHYICNFDVWCFENAKVALWLCKWGVLIWLSGLLIVGLLCFITPLMILAYPLWFMLFYQGTVIKNNLILKVINFCGYSYDCVGYYFYYIEQNELLLKRIKAKAELNEELKGFNIDAGKVVELIKIIMN